jgi:hypothetical protein
VQGEIDSEGNWDGKNITCRLKDYTIILTNKKANESHGMTQTFYKNGQYSKGMAVNGKVDGLIYFYKANGETY